MKKQTIMVTVLAVLLVAALGVIAWLVTHPARSADLEPNVVALTPTPQGQKAPDGIQIPGYPSLRADSSTGRLEAVFENPAGNPCYFTLTLTRADTGEVLWQSGQFEPGKGIQNPALAVVPPPGVYPATLTYTTASLEDNSPLNGAVIDTQVTVY